MDILGFQPHIFNPCGFHLFLLNCFFIASFAISINLFASSQLLYSSSRKSFSFGKLAFTVRASFHKCFPKFNSNGVCLVAVCFLSLYWNSTVGNYYV